MVRIIFNRHEALSIDTIIYFQFGDTFDKSSTMENFREQTAMIR